jgi:hypothetical protein
MAATLTLAFACDRAIEIPLHGPWAILLSPEEPSPELTVKRGPEGYRLAVARKGEYAVELRFLAPLPKADDEGQRAFSMPVPLAVRGSVRLLVPDPALKIEAPGAVHLVTREETDATVAEILPAPGEDLCVRWKPRQRRVRLEPTSFYAESVSLVRFDSGLAEGRHLARFRIAQGELRTVKARLPQGMTVVAVEGGGIGGWRFDPAARELEVRLGEGVTGEYALLVATQNPVTGTPYDIELGVPDFPEAESRRATLGLASSAAVHITPETTVRTVNPEDFVREGAQVIGLMKKSSPRSAAGKQPRSPSPTNASSTTAPSASTSPRPASSPWCWTCPPATTSIRCRRNR